MKKLLALLLAGVFTCSVALAQTTPAPTETKKEAKQTTTVKKSTKKKTTKKKTTTETKPSAEKK